MAVGDSKKGLTVRERVAAYRARLREEGLRPVQIWVPDTRDPEFQEEARRQARVVARSPHESEDQAFIDAVSSFDDA
ncbi:MAG: antitoxin MazE family protein [Nitriliruptoraceae bacterium]